MKIFCLSLCLVALLAIPCLSQAINSNDSGLIDRLMPYKSLSINASVASSSQDFQCLAEIARKTSELSLFIDLGVNGTPKSSGSISLGGAIKGQEGAVAGIGGLLIGYDLVNKKLLSGVRLGLNYQWMQERHLSLILDAKQSHGIEYSAWGSLNIEAQLLKITEPLLLGVSFRGSAFESNLENRSYQLVSCVQLYYEAGNHKRASLWSGISLNKELLIGGSITM